MKDIKELIYAAVEENAVAFQELAGGILQARAYDAIESLRPEIGASMFGESSHMKGKDDEEDEEMEDEEDEDEEDDKKKSMKEALVGKQHEIDVDGNKKINAKDFAKLRAMKKNEEVEQIDEDAKATVDALKKVHDDHNFHVDKKGEISHAYLKPSHVKKLVTALKTPGKGKGMIDGMMEEVEQIDEVEHPKNQADMLAHILHQVKIAGHPVATKAQFSADDIVKDTTKKASLEPGQDKLQYTIAQGGNVKP